MSFGGWWIEEGERQKKVATVKFYNKTVELGELSLDELQKVLLFHRKTIATIQEQLEYPLLLESGKKRGDVSGATFALKQFKAAIQPIEQAISSRLKSERIERHKLHNHPMLETTKERRQKTVAELFVQVAWERMNEPLFDAFMVEAKRRRKNGNS